MKLLQLGRRWKKHRLATIAICATLLAACGGTNGPDDDFESDAVQATGAQVLTPLPLPTPTPLPSPRISIAPADATVGVGAGVAFSVLAAGNGALTYQWFKDGIPLPRETASVLRIATAGQGDAGGYRVRVRDGWGSTLTTADARLTVVAAGWAPLGGRPIYSAPLLKQPALAYCGHPVVAHLMQSGTRTTLYVHYFDGIVWRHFGAGGILNATRSGSASDPSIDCVGDGSTSRPVVAWSEGDASAREVHVKVFNGTDWESIGGAALNINAGSRAVRPSLRVTPFDPNTGNTVHRGLTLRSAVAWIEDGRPSVRQWSAAGWSALAGGAQIPGGANAKDIALAIEFDEIGRTYPPVVAWLQENNGTHETFAATHNRGLATWVSMGAPVSDARGPLPPALLKGRIGVGVGKYLSGRQPLAVWASANTPGLFQAHMYPTEFFVNGIADQPWMAYDGGFSVGAAVETTSFDPLELRRTGPNSCATGDLLAFGLAIAYGNAFEVRRGKCAPGGAFSSYPAVWEVVRTAHNVTLKEIALRMTGSDDPLVAGTEFRSDRYHLSVWKYYP